MSTSQDGSSTSQNDSIPSNPSAPGAPRKGRNWKKRARLAVPANSQSGADSGPSTPNAPTIGQSSTPNPDVAGPSTAKPKPIGQTSFTRKACHTCNLTTHAVANCPVTIKDGKFIPRVKKRNQIFRRLDWECSRCERKQFAENTSCRCGGLRANASYIVETSGGSAGGDPIRPGDWRCSCAQFHLAIRETCSGEKGCGAVKDVEDPSFLIAGPEFANVDVFAFPGPTPQPMLEQLADLNMNGATTDPQMPEHLEAQICADTFPSVHADKIDSRNDQGELLLIKNMHVVINQGRPHGWIYSEWVRHKQYFKRQQNLGAGVKVEKEDDDGKEEKEEQEQEQGRTQVVNEAESSNTLDRPGHAAVEQGGVEDKGKGEDKDTLVQRMAAMQQEIDELKSSQQQLRSAHDSALADTTAAQSQLADFNRNAEEACNNKMAGLKTSLANARASLDKERGFHTAAREEILQLETAAAEHTKATEAVRDLRLEVSQLKRDKAALEGRVERLTADNTKLSGDAVDEKATQRHIDQLNEQNGELRALKDAATDGRETANAELRAIGMSVNELVASVKESGDPVQAGASMVVKVNFLADKIAAFKKKLEDVKSASSKVAGKERTRANNLERQLKQADKKIEENEKEMGKVVARRAELSRIVQEQEQALDESERELGHARESAAASKELVCALADSMRSEDDGEVDHTKSLKSLLAVLADMAERKVKLLATKESEIDNLTDKNIELQDELESARPSPDTPTLHEEMSSFGSGSESGEGVAEMVSSGMQTDEVEVATPTPADHATQTDSLPTAIAAQVDESLLDPVPTTTNSDGSPPIVEPATPATPSIITTMAQPGWSVRNVLLWTLIPLLALAIAFCTIEGFLNISERALWQAANKETIAMLWAKQGGQDDSTEAFVARWINGFLDSIDYAD